MLVCVIFMPRKQILFYLFMFQPHQWSICVEWERVLMISSRWGMVWVCKMHLCASVWLCVCNGEREMWLWWCWMRIRLNMAASTRDNKELQRLERQGQGEYLNKWKKYYCNNTALLTHSLIIFSIWLYILLLNMTWVCLAERWIDILLIVSVDRFLNVI